MKANEFNSIFNICNLFSEDLDNPEQRTVAPVQVHDPKIH
jgi:hypothetical protein